MKTIVTPFKPRPFISVICTTYNRRELVREWLDHIGPCLPEGAEVIVSDDCSTDGTQQMLKKYKAPYPLTIVTADERGGFAHCAARGQDATTGKWVLLTQNDCMFKQGSIDALIHAFNCLEGNIGKIGCMGIAGGIVLRDQGYSLQDWSNWNGDGITGYDQKVAFKYVQVDYLNGFLHLYRGDVARKHGIKIDTQYLPAWEDVDICYQWKSHGYLVIMVSMDAYNIPLIHHIRNVTIRDPSVFPKYEKQNKAMQRVFIKKWYSKPQPATFRPEAIMLEKAILDGVKKRICFVVPGFPINGGMKRILILANGLLDKGYDVLFLSHGEGKPDWFPNKVPILRTWYDAPTDIFIVYECIERPLAKRIAQWKGDKYLLVLSATARKADWVEHNIKLPEYTKVCTTEWLRDYCDSLGEKDRTSRTLLLTGIDRRQFQRIEVNKPKGMIVGCYWKPTDNHQKLDDLEEAFRIAQLEVPNLKLEKLWSNANIHPDRLKEFYSKCDIWLCAADIEGLGMPPLEAMSCRCCLVTTDSKGNRFYAIHGDTALVSHPKEPEALAKNLILAAQNRRIRRDVARKGMAFAHSLSWQDHIDRFESVINGKN